MRRVCGVLTALVVSGWVTASESDRRAVPAVDDRHVAMCQAKTLDYLERIRDAATRLQEFKTRFPSRVNEYEARRRALDRSIDLTAQSFAARQKLAMLVIASILEGEEDVTLDKARTILGCVLS